MKKNTSLSLSLTYTWILAGKIEIRTVHVFFSGPQGMEMRKCCSQSLTFFSLSL